MVIQKKENAEKIEESYEYLCNNFIVWKILKNISLLEQKKDRTLTDLAKEIKVNRLHPYFYKIMSFLMDEEVIKVKEIVGTRKYIYIDFRILNKYIENSEVWKEFASYVHHHKLVYANI